LNFQDFNADAISSACAKGRFICDRDYKSPAEPARGGRFNPDLSRETAAAPAHSPDIHLVIFITPMTIGRCACWDEERTL
jgi:hypothetical protein